MAPGTQIAAVFDIVEWGTWLQPLYRRRIDAPFIGRLRCGHVSVQRLPSLHARQPRPSGRGCLRV